MLTFKFCVGRAGGAGGCTALALGCGRDPVLPLALAPRGPFKMPAWDSEMPA